MSIESPEIVKGKIYELDTVELRSVLRYLNNIVRRTVNPTILASAKHGWCYAEAVRHYSADELERGLQWLMETKKDFQEGKPLPPPNPKVIIDEAVEWKGTPKDPISEALTKPLMAAVEIRLKQFANDIGFVREQDNKKLRDDVGTVIKEFGSKIEEKIRAIEDALMASQSTNLTVLFPDAEKKELGTVHKDQAILIKYLAVGCHVFLTGPAGSGKSTAGEKAAEALGLKFSSVSCCSQDTATKFVGYMDAAGNYHSTEFREAYANGGLFLIDEMDAGNPNILAVLNSALSNSQCAFPDGMVKRHEKFRCMASGNTWGTGKTVQYVGRNAIDAATLNRFVVIYWDYDESLETKIAGLPAWSRFVQQCRAEIKRRGINFLITPRASINGALALKSGIPIDKVIENILFPNLDPDIKKQMPAKPVITEIR